MTGNRDRILVRCDGGGRIGFGHIVRSLALADELCDRGADVVFATRGDERAHTAVKRTGYEIVAVPERPFDYAGWFDEVVGRTRARAVVVDARDGIPAEAFRILRQRHILTAAIDDPTEQRRHVDLAFYPPIAQVSEWDWSGFHGARYAGWEWIVLRRQFRERPVRPRNQTLRVLVTAGASDPGEFTALAVRALDGVEEEFESTVLLGPTLMNRAGVERALQGTHRLRLQVLEATDDVCALMMQADIAVAAFGVTAYELAAAGVPAIHLCLAEEHNWGASALEDEGAAINLGVRTPDMEERLRATFAALLRDHGRRDAMRARGQALVDGLGGSRVADRVMTALSEH